MARIEPLRTLRYEPRAVGGLEAVLAPPYDVIDEAMRAQLAAKSPFNVVEIDLPRGEPDPYLHAQTTLEAWRQQGIMVREREPAIWALTQDYELPLRASESEPRRLTRHGFFCRVRVEDYGRGRIRAHERTHPGPKEDRLALTRATRANLSPIFSLFDDPSGAAWSALQPTTAQEPFATTSDPDGTLNRLWRIADKETVGAVQEALAGVELLIADGHHRYETARVYAEEVGGEGEHSYVLMLLSPLGDPGLTVLPTHRLLTGLDDGRRAGLREALASAFDAREVTNDELQPPADAPGIALGYIDAEHRRPYQLTLKDERLARDAMPHRPDAYRRLDTAVLEAIVLREALGMTDDDIAHRRGLDYSQDAREAQAAVQGGEADAAFLMRATPIEQVQAVAAAGESMPPKSTFFFPKVPTGLVFNVLE